MHYNASVSTPPEEKKKHCMKNGAFKIEQTKIPIANWVAKGNRREIVMVITLGYISIHLAEYFSHNLCVKPEP